QSPGPPDEAAQTISILVTNDENTLFTGTGQPRIDASGALLFTPAPNAHGTAIVTLTLQDSGGTASGGNDTSQLIFNIIVTKPHYWHNTANPFDVTGLGDKPDGHVTPGDALVAINYINAYGTLNSGRVPAPGTTLPNGLTADYGKPYGY